MRLDPLQTPLGKLKLLRSPIPAVPILDRGWAVQQSIYLVYTTQLKPLLKSGQRL